MGASCCGGGAAAPAESAPVPTVEAEKSPDSSSPPVVSVRLGSSPAQKSQGAPNAVDEARQPLLEMTKPGVVTDHELACQAAQKITQQRFQHWAQTASLYPAEYPPPPAGDGSDVFKAADEAGEGMCTRKEIAKYLMRNQTLRHRLREGWAKFNSNFGTEDIAENHEELNQAQFCKLWAEAAALRGTSGTGNASAEAPQKQQQEAEKQPPKDASASDSSATQVADNAQTPPEVSAKSDASDGITPMAWVIAHGLKGRADLNSRSGLVTKKQGERWGVLFSGEEKAVALKAENLRVVTKEEAASAAAAATAAPAKQPLSPASEPMSPASPASVGPIGSTDSEGSPQRAMKKLGAAAGKMRAAASAAAAANKMASKAKEGKKKEGKIGRNDPCPCGNGKKYKKCCGAAGGMPASPALDPIPSRG